MGVRYDYFHTTDPDTATGRAVGPDRRGHPWSRLDEAGDDGPEVVRPDAAQWPTEPGLPLDEIPLFWRDPLAAVGDEALPNLAARVFVDTARRASGVGCL
ncbi:hypothetical protein ACIF70_09795 [Actinacidiphila glaucinigra]|uniref:hypothetical protein n=1 Tax=Actinacidiphila glaucinigra TaxID=235986 RepID=UPI002DD94354|nr:hypothetical protein [Actinacidiphila glaucinigra]WSD61617.1 hypothetical protein OIE69_23290 [Actinacidiphila glaucinigra]